MKLSCELTDTFGGQANYSWVRRAEVELRPSGSCTIAFITFES